MMTMFCYYPNLLYFFDFDVRCTHGSDYACSPQDATPLLETDIRRSGGFATGWGGELLPDNQQF
jgi:hypothetical protein